MVKLSSLGPNHLYKISFKYPYEKMCLLRHRRYLKKAKRVSILCTLKGILFKWFGPKGYSIICNRRGGGIFPLARGSREDYAGNSKLDGTKDFLAGFLE